MSLGLEAPHQTIGRGRGRGARLLRSCNLETTPVPVLENTTTTIDNVYSEAEEKPKSENLTLPVFERAPQKPRLIVPPPVPSEFLKRVKVDKVQAEIKEVAEMRPTERDKEPRPFKEINKVQSEIERIQIVEKNYMKEEEVKVTETQREPRQFKEVDVKEEVTVTETQRVREPRKYEEPIRISRRRPDLDKRLLNHPVDIHLEPMGMRKVNPDYLRLMDKHAYNIVDTDETWD